MIFKSFRKAVVGKMKGAAQKKAFKCANELRNHILVEMAGPKSGNEYPLPGTKRTYTASAPGEYPAIRFGQLRAGVQLAVDVSLGGAFGIVGTNVKHGLFLEGDNGDGIRPWLSRAVAEKQADLQKILKEPWF